MDNYDDIINLPRHVSKKHPRMSAEERAAQFSPFAALTGYGDAVKEAARLTDERIELDEESKALIDARLRIIAEHIKERPAVSITYFKPDEKKSGGKYVTHVGAVRRIDEYALAVITVDKTAIPIEDIAAIDGEIF